MPGIEGAQWTDADFENLSWHDNAVHALRLIEGPYGAGQLHLDLDYILEWLRDESDHVAFRIAPATLEFHGVVNLKVTLDYETPTAGLTPFSLDRIERQVAQRDRFEAILWTLVVNWPVGSIAFEATGFRQFLRGPSVVSSQQQLSPDGRGDGG